MVNILAHSVIFVFLYEVRNVLYDIIAAFELIRFITTKIENTLQLMQNGVFL